MTLSDRVNANSTRFVLTAKGAAMDVRPLTLNDSEQIIALASTINARVSMADLQSRLEEMFHYPTYCCFGLFLEGKLAGITSCWLTTRLYSGKQLEVDNVIISEGYRSQGLGAEFLAWIEEWAKGEGCLTVELNTYVVNASSHKFYFNQGYSILGYHFQKVL